MSNQMQDTLNTLRETLGMVEDLEFLNSEFKFRSNYNVEMGQLQKCFGRVIKEVNREIIADFRDTIDEDVEVEIAVEVEPEPAPEPAVEPAVEPAPAPEPKTWDVTKYCEYFEEYDHLTCDNYVMLLNEVLEVGDNSDEHLMAVEDLIEQAWGLNCGDDLNTNLGRFEDILKARRSGEDLPPVVETINTDVDVVSSNDDSQPTEEIDMSIFNGYKWWSDEDHNGKPEDIFKFALQIDPNTCSLEEFCHGLLYSRVERDTGKEGSLKVAEIIEICSERAFAGVSWPVNGKGVTVKSKAKAIVTPVLSKLKADNDYTKSGLKELTKHGYPTHAFYTQDHLDECVNNFDTPADELDGDDMDSMFESIDPEALEINAGIKEEEPVVEEEAKELKQEQITSAAQRALQLLNR